MVPGAPGSGESLSLWHDTANKAAAIDIYINNLFIFVL
jgi:hypothetical protein